MLTEDALNKMDAYAGDETARKFTLRDIVNQLTHEYRILQQQNAQLEGILHKCFVGGNSLASVLIGLNLPEGWQDWSYGHANTHFYNFYSKPIAYMYYEMWLCWKTLKDAGNEFESIRGNDS